MILLTIMTYLVEILSFLMLFLGLLISFSHSVYQMIPFYRWQCLCLALITWITGVDLFIGETRLPAQAGSIIFLFSLVPFVLFLLIEPLLAQATVSEGLRGLSWFLRLIHKRYRKEILYRAKIVWLSSRPASDNLVRTILVDMVLLGLAFVTSFYLFGSLERQASIQFSASTLAVSLSLLLLGISAMSRKEDIISQVVGLLVMEQGMFLAALRLVGDTLSGSTLHDGLMQIKTVFIIGLLLYTFITLTILVYLLPELHRVSGSIDVKRQNLLKG